MHKNYETVFILTPVLSEQQAKDTVEKFSSLITAQGGEIVNLENMGLRQLAYPIQKKTNGYYVLIEFKSAPAFVKTLEVEFKRDERVMRFLTTALDKFALEYNSKRKSGSFQKSNESKTEMAS
jgi:small subunit ribosomal protein S6